MLRRGNKNKQRTSYKKGKSIESMYVKGGTRRYGEVEEAGCTSVVFK